MILDKDLASIQEVRQLLATAKVAQAELATYPQAKINDLCRAIANACYDQREKLAKMAHEETGFGIWQDKVIKNAFGSKVVFEKMKDMKTIGILSEDTATGIMEVAVPMGVVAGLIPSTNPTSTVMYKTLISIKAGNGIVFSPHPNALNSILTTIAIINEAIASVGGPAGLVGCMSKATMQGTSELMKHDDTAIILATGGSAMVKAAYSSGTPAIGVGPGNGPAFIERSANITQAVKHILDSKTFDNGTICASEQSIVVEEVSKAAVVAELEKQGGYFLSTAEAKQLEQFIMRANGTMNPQIVGKSVQKIADLAGLNVPQAARVLIAEETRVGAKAPYSREKLAPILAFYTTATAEAACGLCIDILNQEGAGHTMVIHSEDKQIIREFALHKPVSRLLVNTPGALGGIGATTNLNPALTLGCGAVGGSSTSDNISPANLFNIRRIAYGVREIEALRGEEPAATTSQEQLINSLIEKVLERLQ